MDCHETVAAQLLDVCWSLRDAVFMSWQIHESQLLLMSFSKHGSSKRTLAHLQRTSSLYCHGSHRGVQDGASQGDRKWSLIEYPMRATNQDVADRFLCSDQLPSL